MGVVDTFGQYPLKNNLGKEGSGCGWCLTVVLDPVPSLPSFQLNPGITSSTYKSLGKEQGNLIKNIDKETHRKEGIEPIKWAFTYRNHICPTLFVKSCFRKKGKLLRTLFVQRTLSSNISTTPLLHYGVFSSVYHSAGQYQNLPAPHFRDGSCRYVPAKSFLPQIELYLTRWQYPLKKYLGKEGSGCGWCLVVVLDPVPTLSLTQFFPGISLSAIPGPFSSGISASSTCLTIRLYAC